MFTVDWGNDSTNCTMTMNGEALTKSGHWSYSNGTITLDKTYLATLDNGELEFVATGNKPGDFVEFTVTVSGETPVEGDPEPGEE